MPRILVIEDDPAVRDVVEHALKREGMEVRGVGDGETALERFKESAFDLALIDIGLPGVDGITLCQDLRTMSDVPLIMLTARDDETSVVVGLEVGADDYITKPFSPKVLVSRVRAHLRRRRIDARSTSDGLLEFPGLLVDLARRQALKDNAPVELTATQFDVLAFLASNPGRVYNREQIMAHLWNGDFYGEARAADVHVQHIRKKIEGDPKNPHYLLTIRGVGYKFTDARGPFHPAQGKPSAHPFDTPPMAS